MTVPEAHDVVPGQLVRIFLNRWRVVCGRCRLLVLYRVRGQDRSRVEKFLLNDGWKKDLVQGWICPSCRDWGRGRSR